MTSSIELALSIQQPFVEQILQGTKKAEYRSSATHIRGRVYLYASMKPAKPERWKGTGYQPGDLPTRALVGTVEIVDCVWDARQQSFAYKLKNPKRLRRHIVPANVRVAGPRFWRPRFPGSPNGSTYRPPPMY